MSGTVGHVFTHFERRLDVFMAEVDGFAAPHGMFWSAREDLPGEALPTVMKKAIEAALPAQRSVTVQPDILRSPMPDIRHIVFDIGSVLIRYDPEPALQPTDPRRCRTPMVLHECLHA